MNESSLRENKNKTHEIGWVDEKNGSEQFDRRKIEKYKIQETEKRGKETNKW